MKTLYVTSFNQKLYDRSGKNFIESFKSTGMHEENHLLVTFEGMDAHSFESNMKYNLENNLWLNSWTKRNADVIPKKYGGNLDNNTPSTGQLIGFNLQAARFFRKVVSLKIATQWWDKYDHIIFADCDVVFKKKIPISLVADVLKGHCLFYHYGNARRKYDKGTESGFTGFNMKEGGLDFLHEYFQRFDDGRFRTYKRWDDAYMFNVILENDGMFPTAIDIADCEVLQYGAHVICHGPFGSYVTHDKGVHQRNKDI